MCYSNNYYSDHANYGESKFYFKGEKDDIQKLYAFVCSAIAAPNTDNWLTNDNWLGNILIACGMEDRKRSYEEEYNSKRHVFRYDSFSPSEKEKNEYSWCKVEGNYVNLIPIRCLWQSILKKLKLENIKYCSIHETRKIYRFSNDYDLFSDEHIIDPLFVKLSNMELYPIVKEINLSKDSLSLEIIVVN